MLIFTFTSLYLAPVPWRSNTSEMKNLILKFTVLITAVALYSCDAEDTQDIEEYNSRMLNVFVYNSDIVGVWDLKNIYSAKPVDLNGDGELNNNLAAEVSCFDPVQIKFNGDKTFSSTNSGMEIKLIDGKVEFLCNTTTTENGIWSLKNNTLTFYVARGGVMEKFDRQIMLKDDSFVFEVDPVESSNYVKDPRSKIGEMVSIVALEYEISKHAF